MARGRKARRPSCLRHVQAPAGPQRYAGFAERKTETMKNATKLALALSVLALLVTGVGCNKLKARDQLNKGVQAYKSARYEQDIEHFKSAAEDDPKRINAHLDLATA